MLLNIYGFQSGFALGFGAGFVTRDLINQRQSIFRPVAKGLLKAGVVLVDRSRQSYAHLMENAEDLLAEVRHEQMVSAERPMEAAATPPMTDQMPSVAPEVAVPEAKRG